MRARQNFIVEFKSSRRAAKRQGTSIWGDADLKAIAREVENRSPEIFEPSDRPAETAAPAPRSSDDIQPDTPPPETAAPALPEPEPAAKARPQSDELAELEDENRRLKARWRSKLRQENTRLKRMLARFS